MSDAISSRKLEKRGGGGGDQMCAQAARGLFKASVMHTNCNMTMIKIKAVSVYEV